MEPRIWRYERAHTRSHLQIRHSLTADSKEPLISPAYDPLIGCRITPFGIFKSCLDVGSTPLNREGTNHGYVHGYLDGK